MKGVKEERRKRRVVGREAEGWGELGREAEDTEREGEKEREGGEWYSAERVKTHDWTRVSVPGPGDLASLTANLNPGAEPIHPWASRFLLCQRKDICSSLLRYLVGNLKVIYAAEGFTKKKDAVRRSLPVPLTK